MSEREPVKGEVWTYGNTTWECIDDIPDRGGYHGWINPSGDKFYADHRRATPPKPERPASTVGWVTIWRHGIGATWWHSSDESHLHYAHDGDYLGALNLETGEWVPRP